MTEVPQGMLIFLTAFVIFTKDFPFVICVDWMGRVTLKKSFGVDVDKNAPVVGGKWAGVVAEEACA